MAADTERIRVLLSLARPLEEEVTAAAGRRGVRCSEFASLCARYSKLAAEASSALGQTFPVRNVRESDRDRLLPGSISGGALAELQALLKGLEEALRRAVAEKEGTTGALPCPKAAGRPCQMHREIVPDRFEVFFAIPFKEPETCKGACDALIEWLKGERHIAAKRIFRADQWTYSGDFVCKICKAIQESRVLVADITGGNPNVFFELGLAIGLGKPAILIHDEKVTDGKVPSDLLAWEYIPYDGKSPKDEEWLEHFGVIFEGTRRWK